MTRSGLIATISSSLARPGIPDHRKSAGAKRGDGVEAVAGAAGQRVQAPQRLQDQAHARLRERILI